MLKSSTGPGASPRILILNPAMRRWSSAVNYTDRAFDHVRCAIIVKPDKKRSININAYSVDAARSSIIDMARDSESKAETYRGLSHALPSQVVEPRPEPPYSIPFQRPRRIKPHFVLPPSLLSCTIGVAMWNRLTLLS